MQHPSVSENTKPKRTLISSDGKNRQNKGMNQSQKKPYTPGKANSTYKGKNFDPTFTKNSGKGTFHARDTFGESGKNKHTRSSAKSWSGAKPTKGNTFHKGKNNASFSYNKKNTKHKSIASKNMEPKYEHRLDYYKHFR